MTRIDQIRKAILETLLSFGGPMPAFTVEHDPEHLQTVIQLGTVSLRIRDNEWYGGGVSSQHNTSLINRAVYRFMLEYKNLMLKQTGSMPPTELYTHLTNYGLIPDMPTQ